MATDIRYYQANYLSYLPVDKNAAVLDFGCGPGYTLTFLKNEGYVNLYGTDIYEADSWNGLLQNKINVQKITSAFTFLPTVTQRFDFIIVKDVIYYFNDDELLEVIKLLKTALKPGGKLLFDVINGSVLTGAYTKDKDFDIKQIFTEHSIATVITRAGLSVDKLYGNQIAITGLRSLVFFLMNRLHQLRLRLLYFSERGFDTQNPKILSKKIIVIAANR